MSVAEQLRMAVRLLVDLAFSVSRLMAGDEVAAADRGDGEFLV